MELNEAKQTSEGKNTIQSNEATYIDKILYFIKLAECLALKGHIANGEKKQYVLEELKKFNPEFFCNNEVLTCILIDSYVMVSNNPEFLKAFKTYKCCY